MSKHVQYGKIFGLFYDVYRKSVKKTLLMVSLSPKLRNFSASGSYQTL